MTRAFEYRRLTDEHLSPEGFGEWLNSKEPIEVVGRAGEPRGCPLAVYLREKTGEDVAMIGPIVRYFGPELLGGVAAQFTTEEWVELFVRHVDDKGRGTPVTAMSARDALTLALRQDLPEEAGV